MFAAAVMLALLFPWSVAPPDPAEWKTEAYAISLDKGDVFPVSDISPSKGWAPDISAGLDASLPFPWPEEYVEKYRQPFNPWAFFRNAAALCTYYDNTGDQRARQLMSALRDRLIEYSTLRDGQRFILYTFPKGYRKIDVEVPWTSAYASGAALVGLSLMAECADLPDMLATGKEVLAGLAHPIDPTKARPDLWVSFIDESGYLWFEEKPLDQEEQPRILNGHIRALTGLYTYWVHTGDSGALELLRAGIKTVEDNAPQYRVPGGINRYDLMGEPIADYGPERTISQQDILYKMTGDPVFAIYRDVFEADMRDDIERLAASN